MVVKTGEKGGFLMQFTGTYTIPASRDLVWRALNDEKLLAECIPGCRSLEWVSDTELAAKIGAKFGPLESVFRGEVVLSDVIAGHTYTMSVSGKGKLAGSARGVAKISLEDQANGTLLRYDAQTELSGILASLSEKLVTGAGQKLADKFFARFSELIIRHYGPHTD